MGLLSVEKSLNVFRIEDSPISLKHMIFSCPFLDPCGAPNHTSPKLKATSHTSQEP